VECVGWLPEKQMRLDVSKFSVGVYGYVGGVFLVRCRRVWRVCPQMLGMCYMRLQLVVSLGCWLLRPMTTRPRAKAWVKMPVVDATTAPSPKYSIDTNALVIYRNGSAYVSFEDDVASKLAHHSDVHLLSDAEAREFEQRLPFPLAPDVGERRGRVVGLGDLFAAVTRTLGLRECGGCRRRKARLNKLPVWRWWSAR